MLPPVSDSDGVLLELVDGLLFGGLPVFELEVLGGLLEGLG